MKKYWFKLMTTAVFLSAMPAMVNAQDFQSPEYAAPTQAAYSQAQLDQMLAPIALYPDQLVAQILMAATYPLEVVQAERWLQNPQNASLKDGELSDALEQESWDPSVKSLVPFPQIIQMMDKNLQWTERLGDAFLAEQATVMDSVQQLRSQAQTAGTLKTTSQQVVSTESQIITIEPANPEIVYVPYYDTRVVYGAWDYSDYPPFYFAPPYGYPYVGAFIGFGIGFAILSPFWGWDEWDWHNHRIDINDDRFRRINHDRSPLSSGVWQHDPAHRGGVPYHSAAVRTQFQHSSDESRRNFRGYSAGVSGNVGIAPQRGQQHQEHGTVGIGTSGTVPNGRVNKGVVTQQNSPRNTQINSGSFGGMRTQTPTAQTRVQAPQHIQTQQHQSAPVFESISRGSEARESSVRGAASRSASVASPQNTQNRGGNGGGGHIGGGSGRGADKEHK